MTEDRIFRIECALQIVLDNHQCLATRLDAVERRVSCFFFNFHCRLCNIDILRQIFMFSVWRGIKICSFAEKMVRRHTRNSNSCVSRVRAREFTQEISTLKNAQKKCTNSPWRGKVSQVYSIMSISPIKSLDHKERTDKNTIIFMSAVPGIDLGPIIQ